MKFMLYGAGGLYVLTALYMFAIPQIFYDSTPGVAMMGPFNKHFVQDAGLAFLTSGVALIWGGRFRNRSVAICGAAWVSLHATLHIWIWIARGSPLDQVAMINLTVIQLPAWFALFASAKLQGEVK